MASKKYKITQLQADETLLELHPLTDADIVLVDNGENAYPGAATDVQGALKEVYNLAQSSSVTDGSAVIATENNGIVTIKAGIDQNDGSISNSTDSDIVLGTAAKKSVATTIDSGATDDTLATAKAVYDAIQDLPEPMIYKGSLGTDGIITELPTASDANNGFTYKVITAGTYSGKAADVGDVFISNGSTWELVPSGDEPSGTVISVGISATSGSHIVASNTPVTVSGNITVGVESGYSIPSESDQTDWSNKYSKPSGGIPKTDLASDVQDSLALADTALQTHQTVTLTGDATGTSTNGSIAVTLANTGVSAGSYSAVTVDTKGRVIAGAQILEVGSTNQTTPNSSLAIGGLFFKEI